MNDHISHEIPTSIFLDDVVNRVLKTDNFPAVDRPPTVDMESMDDSSRDSKAIMSPEDDDVTIKSTTSSSSVSSSNTTTRRPHCLDYTDTPHHHFEEATREERASFQIMSLLDRAGAPRNCYNRLVALLKKLSKKEGFDVRKTLNRETLLKRLERKCKVQPTIENTIINQEHVFRFKFHEMLQDLIHSAGHHLHEILPDQPAQHQGQVQSEHELWNTTWMKETFQMEEYRDFDSKTDRMLPLILYMDKTGTDVNQRYSLEPVLFSVAAIPREHRESRHSWRHIGFIPQTTSTSDEETSASLQSYHDSLSYLMNGLRESQKSPPTLSFQDRNGMVVCRRTFTPLMLVMGDQLSQDTLCGRLKSNSGGAGRVHRRCMCSYLNIDDPYHQCEGQR